MSTKHRFEVGQKVRVKKNLKTETNNSTDDYVIDAKIYSARGKEVTITAKSKTQSYYMEGYGRWGFHESWLEPLYKNEAEVVRMFINKEIDEHMLREALQILKEKDTD